MSKEELKIQALYRAVKEAKGYPSRGLLQEEINKEYHKILEELIKEEIKKENEVNEQGG
jgi:hypothetical protein